MVITPLDDWVAKKIGVSAINQQCLSEYHFLAMKQMIAYAADNSSFYRKLYKDIALENISQIEDLGQVPMINAADLQHYEKKMICVDQEQINRIVTLQTSGTTSTPKRIYFSEADQELTVDFFDIGMQTMSKPGDKVLILLHSFTPGSVGDLLEMGLSRFNAQGIFLTKASTLQEAAEYLAEKPIDVIVANPVQMLTLAEMWRNLPHKVMPPHSILLSSDYVPKSLSLRLEQIFGCKVYEHYGLTETCFGGGVSCPALEGYHLREADLYLEIINPTTGKVLPDGSYGEIVITTLTRNAMPLIRYRTGDWGRKLTDPCPCGSKLPRLDKVQYRLDKTPKIHITQLDEMIFAYDGIYNYDVELSPDSKTADFIIYHNQYLINTQAKVMEKEIQEALDDYQISCTYKQDVPEFLYKIAKRQIKYNKMSGGQ